MGKALCLSQTHYNPEPWTDNRDIYFVSEVRDLGLVLKPIKTKKKYEEIAQQIKQHIMDGQLKPGDKLPSERDLVDCFRVSRASIREAFSALEMMGLVEVRTGDGTYITYDKDNVIIPYSKGTFLEKNMIKEILEVKKMVEVEGIGLAAKRATESEINLLEKVLYSMKINLNSPDSTWEETNELFHYDLVLATHNQVTINLLDNITDQLQHIICISRPLLYKYKYTAELLYQEHADIFEAVKERNADKAKEKMKKHLTGIEEAVFKHTNIA